MFAAAAPYRPADDGEVLERAIAVPERPGAAPLTSDAAAQRAQDYLERARRDADPRWVGYAEGLLQPWWKLPQPPERIWLLRATVRQSRHEFDTARADLQALLQAHRDDAQGWLTLATLDRVQGRLPEARNACLRIGALAAPEVVAICAASVRGLSGGLDEAGRQFAAMEPLVGRLPPQLQGWYWAERTGLLERGANPDAAAAAYRAALAAVPDDLGLRAAHADFLLDHGQAQAALSQLARPGDRNLDPLKLRLLLAQAALGRIDPALQTEVADGFAAAWLRGEPLHLREETRYQLAVGHDFAHALRLARRNWDIQREPWDLRLLLEAAAAAGQPDVAQPARDWIAAHHYQDYRIAEARP